MRSKKNPDSGVLFFLAALGIGYFVVKKMGSVVPSPVVKTPGVAASYKTGGIFDNGSVILRCAPLGGPCCVVGPSPGGGHFVDTTMQACPGSN